MVNKDRLKIKILKYMQANPSGLFARKSFVGIADDTDQIGRALKQLNDDFYIERVCRGYYRFLSKERPTGVFSPVWSKPSGVSDDVWLFNFLLHPRKRDMRTVVTSYGERHLMRLLRVLKTDEATQKTLTPQDRLAILHSEDLIEKASGILKKEAHDLIYQPKFEAPPA